MNADTWSTIRNGERELIKTLCGPIERAKTISSLQNLVWDFDPVLEEQKMNSPFANTSCHPFECDTVIWDIIHHVMCFCRPSLPVSTAMGKVCIVWKKVLDIVSAWTDNTGELLKRRNVAMQGQLPLPTCPSAFPPTLLSVSNHQIVLVGRDL